ncbi:primosomal protein N', partial [Clostridium perfringens]
ILGTLPHEQLPLRVRMAENFAATIKSESDRRGWCGSLDRFDASALDILGPVASPIPRLKNRYRFQCMIKWRGTMDAVSLVRSVAEKLQDSARDSKLQISIDVDPQMLM